LKENKIKPKSKFHEVSKTIYSKIDSKVPVLGFNEYIDMLYRKNFQSSYDVEIAKSLEEVLFFEVGRVFSNKFIMNDYNVSAYFDDSIGGEGVTMTIESMSPSDFIEEFSTSGLKNYLRNNYNDSPPAILTLIHFDTETKTLQYQIDIESSKVGDIHYVPFDGSPVVLDKPERENRAKLEESTKGVESSPVSLTGEQRIALEKEKTKRIKEELKLINQYRKLGYSSEEIRKKLDNI